MKTTEKPTFDQYLHKRIYRYVDRHGSVDPERIRKYVDLDIEHFDSVVSDLKQNGYVTEVEGNLQIALEAGSEKRYSAGSIEYTIRPAHQEDFSEIVKVIRRITNEETYVVAESVAEQLLYEDAVIRHNHAQSRLFFVATVDDTVIGWTHLDTSPIEKLQHTAQQTVGVLEPYRGYGIGGRLMERGLTWAANHDFIKVYNSLPATNEDAIGFLETFGWETEAIRSDHYLINDEFVDEIMIAINPAQVTDTSGGTVGSTSEIVDERLSSAMWGIPWIIERTYRTISRRIANLSRGADFARGVLLGIDPSGLIELGVRGFSETWVHARKQFDPDDWTTVGAKTTVQFMKANPLRFSSLTGGMLFVSGVFGGILLAALTQSLLWGVTVMLGLLNMFLRH